MSIFIDFYLIRSFLMEKMTIILENHKSYIQKLLER